MKTFDDIKSTRLIKKTINLTNEESFIFRFGELNCRYLRFKDYQSIISALDDEYGAIYSSADLEFIKRSAGTVVLCYISYIFESTPNIFVFGDNNISFTVECFE